MIGPLVAVALIASMASADKNQVYIYGAQPMVSCGKWTADRANNLHASEVTEYWVLGIISGYNLWGPEPSGNVASGGDPPAFFGWLDQYCKEKPLDQVMDGVMKLVAELERRKGLRKPTGL